MAKPLLALCATPKIAIKDGYTGENAHILLPFYEFGYWFASGQQYAFGGTIAQDASRGFSGTNKPDVYQKEPFICMNG